jgi:pimeloyl-ACP methyl ester carboxylesterase
MEFQFADFDTAHFRAEPRRTAIGPWTVQHLSFGAPGTTDKPPLVFIGGAFQNAWSFLREVRHFITQRPIILLDLPGQGQNPQISGELTFDDFGDLIHAFLDTQSLTTVIPIGLSYGSGIACAFARRHPDRVDRLVLGATTERIRPRVGQALRAGFWYLDQGRMDAFADAVIHHLLNLAQRESTGLAPRIIDALRAGMLELTENERLRYRHNSTRLFTQSLGGELSCRALVFSARYDHFTAAFEGVTLAQNAKAGEFVLFETGDHLATVESPKTFLGLLDAFVNDRAVSEVPGILTGSAAVELTRERRLLERRPGKRRDVFLKTPDGVQSRGFLLDYNAHGCLFELAGDLPTADNDAPIEVSIPSIAARGDAVLQPDARGARAIFMHDAFGTLGTMPVETIEMAIPSDLRPMGRRASIAERLSAIID